MGKNSLRGISQAKNGPKMNRYAMILFQLF